MRTGFAFVPMILGTTATGFAGVVARIGPRIPVFVGMLMAAGGLTLFAQLDLDSTYAANILPGLIVTGLGIGLSMAPAFSAATSGVDPNARREHGGSEALRRYLKPANQSAWAAPTAGSESLSG